MTEQQTEKIDWQGHRGARGLKPENTLPAFAYALEEGMTTLELDVVVSGDGQLVVSHEPFLNPKICLDTLGNPIQSEEAFNLFHMPYAQISECDCGSLGNPNFPEQERLKTSKPLLLETINYGDQYAKGLERDLPYYNIELKSKADQVGLSQPGAEAFADIVLFALSKTDLIRDQRISLQSFDVAILEALHEKAPNMPLAYLVEIKTEGNALFDALTFIPAVYSPHYPLVNAQVIRFCHEREVKVIPWTVNDLETASALIELGVDGIITDFPKLKQAYEGQQIN
jgi:glycerophosphoryl diester phosphodiesterase